MKMLHLSLALLGVHAQGHLSNITDNMVSKGSRGLLYENSVPFSLLSIAFFLLLSIAGS